MRPSASGSMNDGVFDAETCSGASASASAHASANAAANATRSRASAPPPASRANVSAARAKSAGANASRTPSASRRGFRVANSAGTAWRYGRRSCGQSTATSADAANPAPVQSQRAPSRIVAAASMSGPPSAAASARRAYASGTAAAIDATSGESGRIDARVLPSSRSCAASTVAGATFHPRRSINRG